MLKMIQDVLAAEAAAIQAVPADNPFVECVSLFLESRHRGGKVVVSGVGKAGEVGRKIATTFCSVGLPSVYLHPLEAQHGDLGMLHEQDTLLLISNSGKTKEVVELQWLARRLYQGLKVVALTGNAQSELAASSDLVLWTGGPEEVCPFGLTPTTSTTTMVVIGDVLAVLAIHISGYKANDYALRHHSGYLGEKSRHIAAQQERLGSDEAQLRHVYEALHRENPDYQANNWLVDELDYLAGQGFGSVLEIGCGNGRFARAAAARVGRVVAVDWASSPIMQDPPLPANLDYRIEDAATAELPAVDAVLSGDVLEHFAKQQLPDLIAKLSGAGPCQFHKIACYPDSRGLHLTVGSPDFWLRQFQQTDLAYAILKVEQRRNRADQTVVTIVRGLS